MPKAYITFEWPWSLPSSIYDDGGPRERTEFTVGGIKLCVTPTELFGCDTGRTRYKVECLSCGRVVHPATTGPVCLCQGHLESEHGFRFEFG